MTPSNREIFVVEDDPSVRDSLSFLLSSAGYSVVCFADGEALKATARLRSPACILLDIHLPGRSGLDILQDLREARYPAPVVMMTGVGTIELAVRSLKMGASDFIEKPFAEDDLISRLEQVMANDADRMPDVETMAHRNFSGLKPLTRREREVLHQILLGRSNKDTSEELGMSVRTAEVHRASIMRKLGARNTSDLLRIVFTWQADKSSLDVEMFVRGPTIADSPNGQ